jgi:hypothetical protein
MQKVEQSRMQKEIKLLLVCYLRSLITQLKLKVNGHLSQDSHRRIRFPGCSCRFKLQKLIVVNGFYTLENQRVSPKGEATQRMTLHYAFMLIARFYNV